MLTKEMFVNPFIVLWGQVLAYLPKLIIALAVFLLGWFVAKIAYRVIVKLAKKVKLDEALKPVAGVFEKSGYRFSLGKIIAFLVKWFIIIATLLVTLDILGLQGTKAVLIALIVYIPQVIMSIFVLIAGIALAEFTKKLVQGSANFLNVKSAALLANVARVILIIFSVLVSLDLLIPNSAIINTLFTGIVFMFALAGGLAFGLGGRDAAREAIEAFKRDMLEK